MADIKLIEEITNAFGPSGFEEEVCKVIKKFTEGFDVSNDAMCNVYMKRLFRKEASDSSGCTYR